MSKMEVLSTERQSRDEQALAVHLAAENNHDVDEIMATFAENAVLIVNGQIFNTHEAIRAFHTTLGFSNQGAFSELQSQISRKLYTGDTFILEGTLTGRHTGDFNGIAPTLKTIEAYFCAIYQFNEEGKLYSERVYFNTGELLK